MIALVSAIVIGALCLAQSVRAQTETTSGQSECKLAFAFVTRDVSTNRPVPEVALRLTPGIGSSATGDSISSRIGTPTPGSRTLLSDARGQVQFERLCPGDYTLETIHVSYLTVRRELRLTSSGARAIRGGAGTSAESEEGAGEGDALLLNLVPRIHSIEEVGVRAETVAPMVTLERSSRVVPSSTTISFVSYDLVDAIRLVPGVLIRGDRVFFRGVAAEHVATTVDGVPARHPITGEWILPPPEAVAGAELIASTVVAESAPSLGGLLALRLLDGKDRQTTRVVYGTNGGLGSGRERTDTFTALSAGPTAISSVSYAGSYRGILQSTSLSYDRSLPEQSIMGIGSLGRRMSGEEAASFKVSWEQPSGSNWRANAAVLSTHSRGKKFQTNYSRSGWVGYSPEFDRFTQFLDEPPDEGRDQFYEGPRHVPIEENRSTLLFATVSRELGDGMQVQGQVFHGAHSIDTEHEGVDLDTEAALDAWARESLTSSNHQEEDFYALHGDLPVFTKGKSREVGGGLSTGWKLADHELRGGIRVQGGRHRYLTVIPAPGWWIGSLEEPLSTWDGSLNLQDTWRTDERSWLQLALRYDARDARWKDRSTFAARWSPAIAFHQPMTSADELHVEVGQSYQFPALQSHFPARLATPGAPPVQAQRVRFVEVGFQHHFSQRAVGYVGARERQYVDVVFAGRTPTALEELTGARNTPAASIEQRELEISLDLQISSAITGQTSFVWSRTTAEERAGETTEVPWSRRGYLRSWVVWRASHDISSTLAFSWDSGRPYDLCLLARGCSEQQRIRGRLPSEALADWAATWDLDLVGAPLELSVEVKNVFNTRAPSYDFSAFPMGITADHFLAYWDATSETDGYLRDNGNERIERRIDNPQTRGLGRALLLGVGVQF